MDENSLINALTMKLQEKNLDNIVIGIEQCIKEPIF